MKPISFLPLNTKSAPLPEWILDELDHLQQANANAIDPVKALMQSALDASGISESDLASIVSLHIPYNPRECKIHDSLQGTCTDSSFQYRIVKILNISDEQWRTALRKKQRMVSEAKYYPKECESYRQKGPYLRVLKNCSVRLSFSQQMGYVYSRDLTIDMHGSENFSPHTAEEMSAMISQHPTSCHTDFFEKFSTLEHPIIGGYLYHRLPGEMHTFDAQGKHIASGGIYPAFPPNIAF
jgi:hypothetical protein